MQKVSPINRIAAVRTSRGWSQQKLADAISAHVITISKLERGKMALSSDWLQKIASALSVSPTELLARPESVEIEIEGQIQPDGIVIKPTNKHIVVKHRFGREDLQSKWLIVTQAPLAVFNIGDLIRFQQLGSTTATIFSDEQNRRLQSLEFAYTLDRLVYIESIAKRDHVGYLHAITIQQFPKEQLKPDQLIVDLKSLGGSILLGIEVARLYVIAEAVCQIPALEAANRILWESEP